MLHPFSSARNSAHIRRSLGTTSWRRNAASSSSCSASVSGSSRSGRRNSRPSFPISSDRIPLRNASLKVRPMDITSPTDFICVVRVRSAWGNFSKFQRGIFTTM